MGFRIGKLLAIWISDWELDIWMPFVQNVIKLPGIQVPVIDILLSAHELLLEQSTNCTTNLNLLSRLFPWKVNFPKNKTPQQITS